MTVGPVPDPRLPGTGTVATAPGPRAGTVMEAARPAPGRLLDPEQAELDTGPGGPPGEPGAAPTVGAWAARLTGPGGHMVHARLAGHGAPSASARLVRLGRSLWSELRVKPGDLVTVQPMALAVCEHVTVQSSLALSDSLRQRALDNLRASGAVVWSAAVVALPLLGEGSEVSLTVTDCRPDPAVIGPQTRLDVVEAGDHGHGHSHGADQVGHGPPVPATPGDVGGSAEALARLTELLDTALNESWLFGALGVRPPRGVLLDGPPGTGKTLLARVVASEVGAHVIALSSSELVGSYSGETEANLRKLFGRAADLAPTLILIDEIDTLTTKRDRLASMADVRAASQLLSLLDGMGALGRVMVLGTTNRLAAIDEAFRRPGRFDVEIPVLPPDEAGRRDILAVHTRDMPLTAGAEEALERFVLSGSAGMTGADLMHMAREVALRAARRLTAAGAVRPRQAPGGAPAARSAGPAASGGAAEGAPPLVAVEAEDVVAASMAVRPSLLRGLRVSTEGDGSAWDELVGLKTEKAELLALATEALAPDARGGEGVLLTGAPGSGKSALLRALAGRTGATYVEVDGTAVFTQWLGESEAELRAAFARAREVRPVVVGLEHLEVLAPRRGAHVSGEATRAADRVLGALLSELDETLRHGRAVVVGVTDRPDLVDPAVLRAGRLGSEVPVGLPGDADRRALAATVLGDDAGGAALDDVVAMTAGQPAAAVLAAAHLVARRARRP